jgi:hypothetical protein
MAAEAACSGTGDVRSCQNRYVAEPNGQGKRKGLGRRSVLVQGLAVGAAIIFLDPSTDALASNNFSVDGISAHLNDANVTLEVTPNEANFATGSIGGKPAVFKGSLFGGTMTGLVLDTAFKAGVTQKDQVPQGSNFVTTTTISERWAKYLPLCSAHSP